MQTFSSTATNEPGKGILICQCYKNTSKFERIHAQYPLKFIPTTGHAERLAVVYMLSYGGGIISGDTFNIDISVKENAILLLMTQGNTKVFKDRTHQRLWLASLSNLIPTIQFFDSSKESIKPSVQIIYSEIEPRATLLSLPDPVTCFRDASFQSKQVFKLKDDSSQLVLLDWFTCGRMTRGEIWSFRHYSSRIDVYVDSKIVIKDAMVLDDEEYMRTGKETAYASRLKPYMCFATLIIIAKRDGLLFQSVSNIQKKSEATRLLPLSLKSEDERQVLWSVSPILKNRGVLVRVAGMTTEKVRDFVKNECLTDLQQIVGEGMYHKILM